MTVIPPKKIVAAFDFDGTITYHDSLIYFLIYSAGYCRAAWNILLQLPAIAAWGLGLSTRQKAKESVITRFFKGCTIKKMKALGSAYAKEDLPRHVRPEAKQRIQWHKDQGHTLVLISASIDTYLQPWAEQMGFDYLVSSKLEVTDTGVVTGKLVGANCWGPEKCRRLDEVLGPKHNYTLYAYGDTRGDRELLEIADYGYYREMPTIDSGGSDDETV